MTRKGLIRHKTKQPTQIINFSRNKKGCFESEVNLGLTQRLTNNFQQLSLNFYIEVKSLAY